MPTFLINNCFMVNDVDEDAAIARFHKRLGSGVISIEIVDEQSLYKKQLAQLSDEQKEFYCLIISDELSQGSTPEAAHKRALKLLGQ